MAAIVPNENNILSPRFTGGIVGAGGGAPANAAPVVTELGFFSDDLNVGTQLSGFWIYSDAEEDAEGTHTYQWYRANDNIGTGEAAIAGATSIDYTLVLADAGKFVRLGVIPVALTGTSPGVEAFSAYSGLIGQVTDSGVDVTDGGAPVTNS